MLCMLCMLCLALMALDHLSRRNTLKLFYAVSRAGGAVRSFVHVCTTCGHSSVQALLTSLRNVTRYKRARNCVILYKAAFTENCELLHKLSSMSVATCMMIDRWSHDV